MANPAVAAYVVDRLADLGVGLADPSRRVVLVQGDGAHQLTEPSGIMA
jgi:TPP-dependent 2-oxoacid decarboxylase